MARIQILIAMEIKRFDLVATLFDANALEVSALEAITIVEGDFDSNWQVVGEPLECASQIPHSCHGHPTSESPHSHSPPNL